MRDLSDIRYDLVDMENMPTRPSFARPKDGDIFDEDKTVKWNREEVIRLQQEYDEEVKKLSDIRLKRREELMGELYEVIIGYFDKPISIESAKHIFSYAQIRCHSKDYYEVFNYLEDLLIFVEEILKNERK